MSRPRSPHTGDLDAVLRDDLALEQISRGRRPRGADSALRLLCALAEDVEIRVPRRRMRGSRFTRGVIATAVAATVLGVTGVAAAQPGGTGGFALWTPQPNDAHISAADRSLAEARRSLAEGRTMEATAALNRADAELREARASSRAAELKNVSTTLRAQTGLPTTPHPLPTTQQAAPSWPWAWGIPGGGPGWQPSRPPYKTCLVVVCTSSDGNGGSVSGGKTRKVPYRPQQTPGAGTSSSSGGSGSVRPLLRLSVPTVTARPTMPGLPSPSSPSSPSAQPNSPSATSSPSRTTSTTKPTASSPSATASP